VLQEHQEKDRDDMYLSPDPLSATASKTTALSWTQTATREMHSFKACVHSSTVSLNTQPVPVAGVWEYIRQQLVLLVG
jgi:hypothetical protein